MVEVRPLFEAIVIVAVMEAAGVDNDTRGWIMSVVSGIGKRPQPYLALIASHHTHILTYWYIISLCSGSERDLC